MKKIIVGIVTAALSFTFIPNQVAAAPAATEISVAATKDADAAKANALYNRLIEIKEMDKTNLTKEEKRDLRKEVRDIQKQLAHSGVIYISAGALILILILLIILL